MAEIIKERKLVKKVDYSREFKNKDIPDAGFSFPCDKDGNLLDCLTDAAKGNYLMCKAYPNKFKDLGIVSYKYNYRENAILKCDCGEEFELFDEYMGSCECPKCGRCYNLFGQRLNPRSTWKEGEDW